MTMARAALTLLLSSALLAGAAACGGGSNGPTAPSDGGGTGGGGTPPPGTGGGGTPGPTATITIGSDGRVSPSTVTITAGGRVTFVNNHNRNHEMSSDPHPSHEDCPAMEQVGFLTPGQTKTSGNFNTVRRCGFHDHNEPSTTALQGAIIVQ